MFCFLKKKKGALIHLKFFVARVRSVFKIKVLHIHKYVQQQQNERLVLEFNASHTQCI